MLGFGGLIHMNGRVQDSVTGRFLSPDPYVTEPGHTQGYNRYAYVRNNPASFVDPSGYDLADLLQWLCNTSTGMCPPIAVPWELEEVVVSARRFVQDTQEAIRELLRQQQEGAAAQQAAGEVGGGSVGVGEVSQEEKPPAACFSTPVTSLEERLKNGPDFVSLSFPIFGSFFGVSITVDRYNQFYIGPQVSASWPPVGGAAGFINDRPGGTPWKQIPSAKETSNFIAGFGGTIGAGTGVGANLPVDRENYRTAAQVMTPSVGVSYEFQVTRIQCPP
jgi:RHS repeat-associated protein